MQTLLWLKVIFVFVQPEGTEEELQAAAGKIELFPLKATYWSFCFVCLRCFPGFIYPMLKWVTTCYNHGTMNHLNHLPFRMGADHWPCGHGAVRNLAIFNRAKLLGDMAWEAWGVPKNMLDGLANRWVGLPSGYPLVMTNSLLLKMAIEIVDYPLKMVIFHCYVSLPKGI